MLRLLSNNIIVKINNGGEKHKKYLWDVIYLNIKRTNVIGIIFLVWAIVLSMGQLTICTFKGEQYSLLAVNQRIDNLAIKSRRGKLLDRKGIPLVENTVDFASEFTGFSPVIGEPLLPVRYSKNSNACHLIGYIDGEGNGVSGLEKTFNSTLIAKTYDSVNVIKDARGNVIEHMGLSYSQAKGEGDSVVLTIDAHIQKICQDALVKRGITGAVAVMDVATFDVLAMASSPVYNQGDIGSYLEGNDGQLVNRCVSAYNAGSIFKIVTLGTALEQSGMSKKYRCFGKTELLGHSFACHKSEGHGLQDMTDALKNSCNCSFYEMGTKVGAKKIIDKAREFGLGDTIVHCTDFRENPGNLPNKKKYNPADSVNYAIGQGEILITPIQAANMTAIIANGGVKQKSNIADSIVDYEGNLLRIVREVGQTRVLSEKHAQFIGNAMRLAVTEGTAKILKDNSARIAGKTGTAETGWIKDGKYMVHGWFCGFFPYENPRYAMAVIAENGGSGAESAAPVFGEIAEEIIKIYPIG